MGATFVHLRGIRTLYMAFCSPAMVPAAVAILATPAL